MNFAREALEQIVAEGEVIRHRAALTPVDPTLACQHLGEALAKLRLRRTVITGKPPKLDTTKLWASFEASGHRLDKLNGLQFRALCCDQSTALRPEFVTALSRDTGRLKRSSCLYGLVEAYFLGWRTMSNPEGAEKILLLSFHLFSGRNPVVKTWEENPALFSDRAATFLTGKICAAQRGVDEILKEHYVGPTTGLARAVRGSAAQASCAVMRQVDGRAVEAASKLKCLNWITEKVLSDLTPADAFYETVSALITSRMLKN